MIDVIITAYHMHSLIDRAIASVLAQTMRDGVHITIVDDADEIPYDDVLERWGAFYGDRIRVIRKEENTGCGDSRQVGIDACECKYFTFLDADDTFCSPFALAVLVKTAEEHHADIVSSSFTEEMGGGRFINHPQERTWMHGKIYRTEFVKYHDIRFNLSRANEDSMFNTICYNLCETQCHVDLVTYMWMNNPDSLTRRADWLHDTVTVFVENAAYAMESLYARRIAPSKLMEAFLSYFVTVYGYYCKFLAEGASKEYLKKYLASAKKFWQAGHGEMWYGAPGCDDILAAHYYNNGVLEELRQQKKLLRCDMNEFAGRIGG